MPISQETINEFQSIMQSDYNVNLSSKKAGQQLNNLVSYFNQLIDIKLKKYDYEQNKTVISDKKSITDPTWDAH